MLSFEWDSNKAKANKKKHGVSFEEGQTVFADPFARVISDPDHSEKEDRFIILGSSERLRILVVCHCYREDESVIRIFSVRKADKEEQEKYTEYLP